MTYRKPLNMGLWQRCQRDIEAIFRAEGRDLNWGKISDEADALYERNGGLFADGKTSTKEVHLLSTEEELKRVEVERRGAQEGLRDLGEAMKPYAETVGLISLTDEYLAIVLEFLADPEALARLKDAGLRASRAGKKLRDAILSGEYQKTLEELENSETVLMIQEISKEMGLSGNSFERLVREGKVPGLAIRENKQDFRDNYLSGEEMDEEEEESRST